MFSWSDPNLHQSAICNLQSENNGPMPFIVDDVLVRFDDDRSAAALAGMARLAQNT